MPSKKSYYYSNERKRESCLSLFAQRCLKFVCCLTFARRVINDVTTVLVVLAMIVMVEYVRS